MATGIPCFLQQQTKLGQHDFCFYCCKSLNVLWCSKKKTNLSNLVKHSSHLESEAGLQETLGQKNGCLAPMVKWHFSHSFALLAVQANCSCFLSSYHLSLCKNWSSGSLKQQKQVGCSRSLNKLQATMIHKDFFVYGEFSYLNLMFYRLSRSIVDVIMRGSSLSYLKWALECKKIKFHTAGLFSCWYLPAQYLS